MKKGRNYSEFCEAKLNFVYDFYIENFFRNKKESSELQVISDRTCSDLDFDELFSFIDRTNSNVGQQFFYDRLRRIPIDSYYPEPKQKIIDHITSDIKFRARIAKSLSSINSFNSYYLPVLFQDKYITAPKWMFVIKSLSVVTALLVCLSLFFPVLLFVLVPVVVANILIHFWNKNNIDKYKRSIPQLIKLCKVSTTLSKEDILSSINPDIKKPISKISSLRKHMYIFADAYVSQNEIAQAAASIIEYTLDAINILFLIEPIVFFNLIKKLESNKDSIEELFCYVGEVDTLYSIASLRGTCEKTCKPNIADENPLASEGLYHPLVLDCVSNDISLDGNSMLLTGSNMSGKTTFIRTIGINVITALTLDTCFAQSFSLPKTTISTVVRIADDLLSDKSYYFEEVSAMKEVLESSKSQQLGIIILDEIFKGTNTIERVSVAKAVLSYLAKSNNIVFASTHDMELVEMLSEQYKLYHFSEQVTHDKISFDYKLKSGCSTTRNAIKILEINGYPSQIVDEANEIARTISK